MKSLLITLLFAFVSGFSLSAQVYPGEYVRENTYLKFQGDSIGVWVEIEDQIVVITRNGQSRAIQVDSIIQHGDIYIIQTPSAQYYINTAECLLIVQPPFYTASFEEQVVGCERTPVKCKLRNGKSYYVYLDTQSSGESFRVEHEAGSGYRRIWIGREALEAGYLSSDGGQ